MKRFTAILITLVLFSCGNEEVKDFTLKGNIEDLKKGTVFLKRQQDSVFVTLDSLEINGNSSFEMHAKLEEPEILFLSLDKNGKEDDAVVFFADKGVTEINSTLKNFSYNAKVKGSKQQEVLNEYLLMMSKFNDKNLEIIKESLESQMAQDSTKTNQIKKDFDGLLKRKYLYTINFAVNHKDSEVAPYLAISEIPNTSVNFLNQIYEALDDNIKNSKYGTMLKERIEQKNKDSK